MDMLTQAEEPSARRFDTPKGVRILRGQPVEDFGNVARIRTYEAKKSLQPGNASQ